MNEPTKLLTGDLNGYGQSDEEIIEEPIEIGKRRYVIRIPFASYANFRSAPIVSRNVPILYPEIKKVRTLISFI